MIIILFTFFENENENENNKQAMDILHTKKTIHLWTPAAA